MSLPLIDGENENSAFRSVRLECLGVGFRRTRAMYAATLIADMIPAAKTMANAARCSRGELLGRIGTPGVFVD